MTPFDIFLSLLLGVLLVGGAFVLCMAKELAGINRLLLWSRGQLQSFAARGETTASEKEKRAIREILSKCEKLKQVRLEEWDFKAENFSLIEKISSIYHPDASVPLEQARLGDILEAVQEANQKVLSVIHLPRINSVTQFRLIQVLENLNSSSNRKNRDQEKSRGIWNRLLKPVFLMGQTRVVRSLLTQWVLLVGEAAIKVYGTRSEESDVEAEAILAEWDTLQDEPSVPLPENVEQIVSTSKKEILFSATSISWKRTRQIYLSLADQIARHYHSDSPFPIYEVRVCDLLKSVADTLDGIGRLSQKPVLNKLLRVRVSQLTQARDFALPLGQNKIMEWVNKYQVGSVAKWSHTLYKTLQKKQPGVLLRDVVFAVVKEGGKRWLVLHLHRKIAVEANKLYGR